MARRHLVPLLRFVLVSSDSFALPRQPEQPTECELEVRHASFRVWRQRLDRPIPYLLVPAYGCFAGLTLDIRQFQEVLVRGDLQANET